MTCIVGALAQGQVWIGGDSYGFSSSSGDAEKRGDPKVFISKNPGFIMGFTTSYRFGQLLRYAFQPPEIQAKHRSDPLEYFVNDFVPALRETLKAGGFSTIDNNVETGGQVLVGCELGLFEIGSDFQVAIPERGYSALGAGYPYALGALHALGAEGFPYTTQILTRALEAAEEHNAFVRRPFHFVSLPYDRIAGAQT